MLDAMSYIAARSKVTATPVPGVGEQVASDLKDTVSSAAETAGDWLSRMPQVVSRTLLALAVLAAGLIAWKIGKLIIRKVSLGRAKKNRVNAGRSETSRSILSSIFSYLMFFIVTAVILRLFGVDVTSMLAAAGVVGVAIAFGAQTLVKDILSGLFIWGEHSMSVGDIVNINDLSGTVEAITIRTTSIRNFNGNVFIIPNGDIRTVTNMSRGFKRAIVDIPCPYEENQERLIAMIREEMETAALEVDGIKEIPAVMSIVAFDKNSVRVQVAVPCPVGEHWRIERDLRTRIKARFDREGIVMPHYSVPEGD